MDEPVLFALGASRPFGEKVAGHLGLPLSAHEERPFEDGEHKARPLVNVRGRDVFVIHSLYGDEEQGVNDKLLWLLFFIGALKDASAERVTAVVPYLCYARKDRKTKPRDPVTTRYVACLFEAAGADRVVTMDVHNLAAFQNAFRRPTDHLEARPLFVRHLAPRLSGDVVVVSPDVGGVKRAEAFRESLEGALKRPVASAFMEKFRSAGVVSGEALVGEVRGKTAIILDDLISTGTTLRRAVKACQRQGAEHILAAATHGLFVGSADALLAEEALEELLVADTVPPFRLDPSLAREKLTVIESAGLFAEAIRRIHTGGSIVELLAEVSASTGS